MVKILPVFIQMNWELPRKKKKITLHMYLQAPKYKFLFRLQKQVM